MKEIEILVNDFLTSCPTMKKITILWVILFSISALFTSCAPAGHTAHKYGFWSGIFHGLLFLPDLIGKILGFGTGIYAQNNDGLGYWVGYFIGFFFLGFGQRFLKK